MPNPGSFLGTRLEFLQSQRRRYEAAVIANSKAECVADIQRCYFKRFPIEHEHNVDPTPEFLASVNDDEADAEVVAPDRSSMSPEEFKQADQAFKERQKLVTFRKEVSLLDFLSRVLMLVTCDVPSLLNIADASFFLPSSKSNDGSTTTTARPAAPRSERQTQKTQSLSLWLV